MTDVQFIAIIGIMTISTFSILAMLGIIVEEIKRSRKK